MSKNYLKQIFSASLSLALAVTSAPVPAFALGPVSPAEPAFVNRLTPPERFGYVSSSFSPNKDIKAPRLIMISDLHAHVEVQHNIVGILHDVVEKLNPASGKKVPIFVEGGWERNLEEPLKTVSNANVRALLDEYLLQKSQMGAAQAFSEQIAGSNKVSLIGIENKAEYDLNRKVFVKSYPVRKRLLIALAREEKAMKELSKYIANGSFEKLQAMRDDYNAGRITTERYAKAMSHQAARFHVTGHPVDVLNDWQNAKSSDLEVAFAQVYRAVAKHVAQGAPWTSFLRKTLGNEETMRQNIAQFDADFDLLKRLVSNQLTPGEVPLAAARMPYLSRMAQSLVSNEEVGMSVKDAVERSLDFYPCALVRDESLVKNSMKELDALHDPEATGILVVGGFHADAIAEYLRNHGISYLHINPTVTRDMTTEEQINYAKRLADEPVSDQEFDSDMAVIAKGGPRNAVAGSAIGPVGNTADPGTPGAMGGGGLARRYTGDPAHDVEVLRAHGLSRAMLPGTRTGVVAGVGAIQSAAAEAATLGTNPQVAARMANLAEKIEQVASDPQNPSPEMRNLSVFQDRSFTLVRNAEGIYVVEAGHTLSAEHLENANKIADKYNALPKGDAATDKLDFFIAPDEAGLAMGAEGYTFHQGKDEKRAAIVVTESRVAPIVHPETATRQEKNQAEHVFAHEGSHAGKFGAQTEGRPFAYGLLGGAVNAAEGLTGAERITAIQNYLEDNMGIVSLYQGTGAYDDFVTIFTGTQPTNVQFRLRLAENIAAVISGPNITDEQIKKIAEDLHEEFPNVPDYLIAKSLNDSVNGFGARMGQIIDPNDPDGRKAAAAAEARAKGIILPGAQSIDSAGTAG